MENQLRPNYSADSVILDVRGLSIAFGGLRAVSDFNLSLRKGELVGLIGPNGAGKTTVFNLLTGIYKPSEGDIIFRGKNLTDQLPHNFSLEGIARTFQNIRLFKNLTVQENIKIAYRVQEKYNLFSAILRSKEVQVKEHLLEENCLKLLDQLELRQYANSVARNLPYGVQRRVEIVRALASKPDLLLLDEPAAGMNPQEVDDLADIILEVKEKFDVTILLIEHHMDLVMKVCQRIKVMNFGEVIAEGTPEEIKVNPIVIEAYLGKGGSESNAS